MKKYSYIIFDGECGFCNKIVMFLARNDKNNNFKFISSHSEFGTKILLKNKIKGLEESTIILVEEENKIYTKSVAIRKVLVKTSTYKIAGYLMFLFPKKLADYVYNVISKYRKLVIKSNICEIPNIEIRNKFTM